MIRPSFEELKKKTAEGTIIPVVKTLLADTETPVSAYLKIRDRSTYSFLLESVEGGEKVARYSFLGADPFLIFRSRGTSGTVRYLDTGKERRFNGDPIGELRTLMESFRAVGLPGLPRFTGGGVGYFAYDAVRLVDIARRCRDAGIAVIRDGARLGDIGAAIEELARDEGVAVVTAFGGHGIGRRMHAEPHVAHTGNRGAGRRLKAGMALTVEPMINLGGAAVRHLDDGWTIVTADGSLSAQWEHTVVVTADGCEITTALREAAPSAGSPQVTP